jgi:hypothetical protein
MADKRTKLFNADTLGAIYVQFVLCALERDGSLFHGLSIALGLTFVFWQQIRQTHKN